MENSSNHITQVNYSNVIICLVSRISFTHDTFVFGALQNPMQFRGLFELIIPQDMVLHKMIA